MSFVRKVTHQLVGPTTPYNVLQEYPFLYEQKLSSQELLFIGAMTSNEIKETPSTTPRQLGDYANIQLQKDKIAMGLPSDLDDLPYGEYYIYAPVIGKMKSLLGNPAIKNP